ncbi:MAG: peptidoglycan-binding protein, partial [bacterium]|nr:peptidoglycan-binding protein [bacterium]
MNSIKHKTAKKITSVLLSATTMVWLAGASAFMPMVASADAATDALIAQLQAQIAALTSQLAALSSSSTTSSSSSSSSAGCSFSRSLTVGLRGDDVTCLQNYLTSTGHFNYSGGSTGYFGEITRAAVAAWQAANSVFPPAGYFGAISRAKYASMVSSTSTSTTTTTTTTTTTPPAGSALSVTAGSQPANSLAP